MRINAEAVRVDGPHGPLLRETSFSVEDGEVALVAGEPGAGHSALALVLSGRLEPSAGDVLLDDSLDTHALQAAVAPIDVPGVSAPEPGLVLSHVVAEELVMAHKPARRSAVKKWLEARDAAAYFDSEIGTLPASTRIRILADLAAARRGVRALVLTSPDRHGGRPEFWWRTARGYAAEGFAVIVLCTETSARELGVEPHHLGRPEPHPALGDDDEAAAAAAAAADEMVPPGAWPEVPKQLDESDESEESDESDESDEVAAIAVPDKNAEDDKNADETEDHAGFHEAAAVDAAAAETASPLAQPSDEPAPTGTGTTTAGAVAADDDGPHLSPIELQAWRAARGRTTPMRPKAVPVDEPDPADPRDLGASTEPAPARTTSSASGVN